MQTNTQLIHYRFTPHQSFDCFAPPVYKASTVFFANCAEVQSRRWFQSDYTYGLNGTPLMDDLAARIALLEGGRHGLLVPSGLAAILLVDCALLKAGDHILIPYNAYAPNPGLIDDMLSRFAISYSFYNPLEVADAAAKITPATRLIWLEAAGSNTLEFPDLEGLIRLAQSKQLITALDNTWGAGIAFSPFAIGRDKLAVDVSVQALTKFPSGGADVLMGAVVTQDKAIFQRLKNHHHYMGIGVAANDIELVLRGLPTLGLRYRAHQDNALAIARFLEGESRNPVSPVGVVFHPALASSPGHHFWRGITDSSSCLTSFVFKPQFGYAAVEQFCNQLKLFRLGYSWAGPTSLVMFYGMHGSLWQQRHFPDRDASNSYLLRLGAGLEAGADLLDDLKQSLAMLV